MTLTICPNCEHAVTDHGAAEREGCCSPACRCPLTRQQAARSLAVAAAILYTREE